MADRILIPNLSPMWYRAWKKKALVRDDRKKQPAYRYPTQVGDASSAVNRINCL